MILKKIENEKIRVDGPASYTTAKYLTINDLSKLSNCIEKYRTCISNKEKTEEPIEKYFETAKKMMVYQLGISFFVLVMRSFPIKDKHLCELKGAKLQASYLDNEKIKKNIEKKFKEIKKNVLSSKLATLEKIEALLINMLKVKAKDRVDIEFVKKEIIILEKFFEGNNI